VLVLGPGGGVGRAMQDMVRAGLATDCAAVLDADALTSFSDQPQVLLTATRNHAEGATVLTPHEGEFSRIFASLTAISQVESKLEKTRRAAAQAGAIVLLKGPDTVVAAPDGRAAIADNAPPWLATAGSGDVLAGMVAGLLAQGMPCFEAAAAAVWLHGEAGSAAGPGLIAEDLPEMLPRIYRRLFAEFAR
jgi:ADP-dependent NAD(P)H-hydrate dehydratase / NAD(P)H-hydrate epimerase